jgi:hypothetical protein
MARRTGNAQWTRLTEERAGSAKSAFRFDVQAKSTQAGIPWLRIIRQRLGGRVHFWPFDGWNLQAGRSAVVEVYPSLWSRNFACEERNGDQHDAYSAAAWMRRADLNGEPCRVSQSVACHARARGGTGRRVDPRSSVIIINHRDAARARPAPY